MNKWRSEGSCEAILVQVEVEVEVLTLSIPKIIGALDLICLLLH